MFFSRRIRLLRSLYHKNKMASFCFLVGANACSRDVRDEKDTLNFQHRTVVLSSRNHCRCHYTIFTDESMPFTDDHVQMLSDGFFNGQTLNAWTIRFLKFFL